jgi:alpha-beta hydrolase superfamily lysophospholipase
MPFFDGVSGRVHYRRWPLDERRAVVVFLPGMGQHTGHYHRFAKAIGVRGIETWAIDHVGHGLSEGEEGVPGPLADLAVNARSLIALVRDLQPDVSLVLMGHSLGAATALLADDAEPLVLCGTPVGATSGAFPQVPILLIHGIDDRRCPIDAVREWVQGQPDAELREYADAGHDLLHEPVYPHVTADVADWVLRL